MIFPSWGRAGPGQGMVLAGGEGGPVQGVVLSRGRWISPSPDHVTYPMMHLVSPLPPPPKLGRMTDACENITFARFATWVVINIMSLLS